jgi:hypothetical protein
MIIALSYDKPENVVVHFNLIKDKILKNFSSDDIIKFLEYFDVTYIVTNKKSLFEIKSWSVYKRVLLDLPTTTNDAKLGIME